MSRKIIKVQYGIEMKEPRRFPTWLRMLLILALIVLAIYLIYHFVVWILAPTEEDIELLNATPSPTATYTPEPTPSPTPTPRPSPTINPDISYELSTTRQNGDHVQGWVNIPGLGLNTVIVQGGDNSYFKDFDFNLNNSGYGSAYFDYRTDASYIMDAGHIVIYGYNNLGGRQLKLIAKYAQKQYFIDNSLIVLETLYGRYHFRLFSVHIEDDDTPFVEPVEEDDKKEFIDLLLEKTMFAPSNFPENDSVILTFSIDVESAKGERLLVHAFLEDQ